MFQGAGVFMSPIAIVIAILAGVHSIRHAEDPLLTHWTMGMFAAGAIGNLIDRVAFGKVTDMFWFRAINFPVFNVADALISVATALLILSSFQSEKRQNSRDAAPLP
jgi:signal peptidase II